MMVIKLRSEKEIARKEHIWAKQKNIMEREEKIKFERRNVKKTIRRSLGESPINYWSDLFIVFMVTGWMVSIPVLAISAIYSMVSHCDNSVWAYFTELVTIPISAGGSIWMIKNSVQHAIANKGGVECPHDFPRLDVDISENERFGV